MSNHLIIGLGGTGGKIIRAFRKIIYQEFRQTEPLGVKVGYLYVDSDNGMMGEGDPSWNILGESVQLNRSQQVCIEGANLHVYLDDINAHPGIKPWIGNQKQWNDILATCEGVTILGGQKRRLGRFLLACKVDEFIDQLNNQVTELHSVSGESDVTFHVCCGLAGGTGSGIIIDVITQIRKYFSYNEAANGTYRLMAYTLLPEENPQPNWDTGNYHANGYAALVELNALSAGRFTPYDISPKSRDAERINRNRVMFNGLYLFTNKNENGKIINVENEVPNMLADFLYQKIVVMRNPSRDENRAGNDDNNAWLELRRAENMENGDPTPETAPIPDSQTPERVKRFLTFGINRVAFPEEEIKENLTYHFARQVALQLKYNHWSDLNGFIDQAKNQDFNSLVEEEALQNKYLLTQEYLCLSKAILPQDIKKGWKTIDQEWENLISHYTSTVRNGPKKTWLEELSILFEKRFEEQFRSGKRGEPGGVQKFYTLKKDAVTQMAKEIRQKMENDLFLMWTTGETSIHEIVGLVSALIKNLEARKDAIEAQVTWREKAKKTAQQRIKANNETWANAWISRLFKANSLLDQQALNLCDLYTAQTWIEALGFSKKLIVFLLEELRQFQSELSECLSLVSNAADKFNKRLNHDDIQNNEIQEDDIRVTVERKLVRFYEPNLVKEVTRLLISNEEIQRTCATGIRKKMVERMGNSLNFSTYVEKMTQYAFIQLLVLQSENNVRREHDIHIKDSKKLLKVNIIEKLRDKYEADLPALRSYVSDLVKQACNYLPFSTVERNRKGAGIPDAKTMLSSFTVILPPAPQGQRSFVENLESIFNGAYPGRVFFSHTDSKPNEITMINTTNLFPLRFVNAVSLLREKYLLRINNAKDPSRAKLEVHTEDSEFPSLFVPSVKEIENEAIPYLLLARALDLIVLLENRKTGVKEWAFTQDRENVEDFPPIYLGTPLVDSFKKGGVLVTLEKIKQCVKNRLDTEEYQRPDKRKTVEEAMLEEVRRIRTEECDGDTENEGYKRFNEGRNVAREIMRRK
jgi:hypothetical protein